MTRTHPKVSGKSHQTTGSLKWQEWQISVNLTVGGIQHRPISAIILYQDKLHQKENLVARNFAIKVFALTSLLAQSNDIQESLKLDLGKISRRFSLEQDCWIWKKIQPVTHSSKTLARKLHRRVFSSFEISTSSAKTVFYLKIPSIVLWPTKYDQYMWTSGLYYKLYAVVFTPS